MCICLPKNVKLLKTDNLFNEFEKTGTCQAITDEDWNYSNLMNFHGFEIPRNTKKETKKLLRALKEKKVISIEHDDGLALIIAMEMQSIVKHLEIGSYRSNYRAIFVLEDEITEFKII